MNPFEKQLVKEAAKTASNEQNVVDEAKLLLASNAQEEIDFLKRVGLDNDLQYLEDKNEQAITRELHTKKYDKTIVTLESIKALCIKYRLQMQPASNYMGPIPNELGATLLRYCKEKNIAIPASKSYSNFYIIAPPKMFKDYKSGTEVVAGAWNEMMDERNQRIEREKERQRLARENDPILVYKIDNKYAGIVQSWGSDFTWLRQIYGFLTKNITLKLLNMAFIWSVLFMFYKVVASATLTMYSISVKFGHNDKLDSVQEVLCNIGFVSLPIIAVILGMVWIFNKDIKAFRRKLIENIHATPFVGVRDINEERY